MEGRRRLQADGNADDRPQDGEQRAPGFDTERTADRSNHESAEEVSIEHRTHANEAGARTLPAFDGAVSDDERRRMVAEAAYFIAQRRGFDGGLELEDWLAAEAEVNARLASR